MFSMFFFQAEDGIRDRDVTGVQTCALPIFAPWWQRFRLSRHRVLGDVTRRRLSSPEIFRWMGYLVDSSSGHLGRFESVARSRFRSPDRAARTTWAARSEERRVGKGGRCGSSSE